MSSQVQNAPSNLTRYLTEKPEEMGAHYQCKTILYTAAMVVSAIGAIAIFSGVTALYLGVLGTQSLSQTATFGTILIGCLFSHGVHVFSKWKVEASRHCEWYQALSSQLQKIKHWDERAIEQFFVARGKFTSPIPPQAQSTLLQINRSNPLLALLPLIARCQLNERYTKEWKEKRDAQRTGLQNIRQLPPTAQAQMRKIYESLEAQANTEMVRYERLTQECLAFV